MKNVVQDLTSAGIDWQREKWQSGLGSKFIHQGEKNAAKYADEVIVLSKGVQDYFKETYGRETHFIPNGVNADGNMSKEEFIRQRDAYRVQEDERMAQIQRLRTEKNQIFLPVRKDADNLQTVVSAAEEAGDVMNLSQNVVETFIDRIEVFNDKRVKIRFTFEDALNSYEEK